MGLGPQLPVPAAASPGRPSSALVTDSRPLGAPVFAGAAGELARSLARVVFVAPERLPVPPVQGGAVEHWIDEVARRLVARGATVDVVSRPAVTGHAGLAGQTDLAACSSPSSSSCYSTVPIPWGRVMARLDRWRQGLAAGHPGRALAKAVVVGDYARGVRRTLQEREREQERELRRDPSRNPAPATVVAVHNDPVIAAWLAAGPRGARPPLLLHMHNDHLEHPVLRPLVRALLPRTARVLFVSDHLRHRAAEAFPEHAHRMATVLNGTDTERFRPAPRPGEDPARPFTFVFAGRLVPQKGVHVLLQAFARVRAVRPSVRLLLAGSSFFDGAPRTAHERDLRAQAAGLREAIAFTGFLPHDELARRYAEAGAVVVPSVWADPCPLVVLEAMASGACVIASRTGGIPELIEHGRNGLLVPPGDAVALAAAMLRCVDEADTRARLAREARKAVLAHHTWDHVAAAVAAELARATGNAQFR